MANTLAYYDTAAKCFIVQATGVGAIKTFTTEYLRGKYHCTIDLLFDWFEISCMTADNFGFYLQNRLIQTI